MWLARTSPSMVPCSLMTRIPLFSPSLHRTAPRTTPSTRRPPEKLKSPVTVVPVPIRLPISCVIAFLPNIPASVYVNGRCLQGPMSKTETLLGLRLAGGQHADQDRLGHRAGRQREGALEPLVVPKGQ